MAAVDLAEEVLARAPPCPDHGELGGDVEVALVGGAQGADRELVGVREQGGGSRVAVQQPTCPRVAPGGLVRVALLVLPASPRSRPERRGSAAAQVRAAEPGP